MIGQRHPGVSTQHDARATACVHRWHAALQGWSKTAIQRIDIDDPEVDMDDSERLYYSGQPFTGEVTEHFGESLVSIDSYVDGYKNGPSREWHKDGTLRSEGTLREGLPVGEFKEWHSNGVLAAKQVFAENGMTLLEDYTWDEHGRPTRTWRKDATNVPLGR